MKQQLIGEHSAFACAINEETEDLVHGLSKREYIATQLLAGLLAGCHKDYDYGGDKLAAAMEAVQYADALIAELNKPA